MHPNCNCRTGILDKNGNIAFYAEDLRDGKIPERTRPRTLPAIQPWTLPQTQKEEAKKGDEITELSESEALFIAKLQSIGVSFDKALEILYEMKRTNGKVPEEKYKEWGFADKAGIAYVELQYKMIREGMTLEQYDYLESNASLSTATSIAITQLARAAIQKVQQRAVEKQIKAAKNEGTNKGNTAKPTVQQGTVGEETKPSENVGKWKNPDGSTKWPANDGFKGTPIKTTLQPGTKIDRYGDTSGIFVAPKGTSFNERSLAPGSENSPYNAYEVIRPFDVQAGTTAPWFDQPGGGMQYKLPMSVKELIMQGYIIPIS